MDFQISSLQQMDTRIQKFLDDLAEKGYSEKPPLVTDLLLKKHGHIFHIGDIHIHWKHPKPLYQRLYTICLSRRVVRSISE